MMTCAGFTDKALVAIGAFHKTLVAHFQIDLGVAQRAAAAVAGDAAVVGFDGFRDLDRHGKVPVWLAERMARIGLAITTAIVQEEGPDGFLRRLSNPFWFQSLGAVMGMDWHSSGITTSVMGALKKALQPLFDPLLISWGYESANPSHSRFLDYHQLQGTRDYTAFLSIPEAIGFMQQHNWDAVNKKCRAITQSNAERFCRLLNAEPICPATDDFIAQMCSIPIKTRAPQKLHDVLYEKYNIQVPIMPHGEKFYLRYSIQGYNSNEDLDKLYNALKETGGYE